MDNKKFEQLIDLIINEDDEQARALFHDIVVEKSREIYESMMDEDMEEGTDQVEGLLDEINSEESGMTEEEEEMDDIEDMGDEVVDIEADVDSDEGEGEEDLEDRVVDLEDKLDELMAEFEAIMGHEEEEMDMDSEEDMDMDSEEDMMGDEDSEEMMEAIQLKKVAVTHGDNGAQTKSPGLQNSGQAGMDSKPVKFSGQAEADPKGPKAPSNAYSKGEGEVKHAKQWKNAPAQAGQDLEKAPAPKKGDDGANTKSPVAESRKTAKKRI